MHNVTFLAYLSDPFATGSAQYVTLDANGNITSVSIEQLESCPVPLVTYEVPSLIDEFIRLQKVPPILIDIGDALRLRTGLSKDQGGEKKWSIWRSLTPYFEDKKDKDLISALAQSRLEPPDAASFVILLTKTVHALRNLWTQLIDDLDSLEELARFTEIEIPVQQIFWYRQYKGIRINTGLADELMEKVKKEKYDAFREVASIIGVSPSGLKFSDIGKYIENTDARHLAEFSHSALFREYFRIARDSSVFARAYWQYDRAGRDLSILKRIYGGGDRVYPIFQPFGTVTGRILVSDPRLQQLQKKYRSIIDADDDKELLYLDYSQYEPGILGALSGDEKFIQLYDSSDVYVELSKAIFGNEENRSTCKRIFLGYCYGMQRRNIAKLLAGAAADESKISNYEELVQHFFEEFPRLDEYRRTLESKLQDNGYISSIYGNRRIRSSKGELTNKERRWSISQVVQGTASLIFKEALLNLSKEFGRDSILLPMHDAVLMQINGSQDEIEKKQKRAIQVMKDSYAKWISGVTPRITLSKFDE